MSGMTGVEPFRKPEIAEDGLDYKVTELPGGFIEGHARMALEAGKSEDEAYFHVPAISHVIDNLYQGGYAEGYPPPALPGDFVRVVSLYPWGQYTVGPNTELVEYEMYDAGEIPAEKSIFEAANLVREGMERGKTIVHCQAGLNRSGLVAATALILDGMKPQEAIDLLRKKRSPLVLCNHYFEEWLLGQGRKMNEAEARVDRIGG